MQVGVAVCVYTHERINCNRYAHSKGPFKSGPLHSKLWHNLSPVRENDSVGERDRAEVGGADGFDIKTKGKRLKVWPCPELYINKKHRQGLDWKAYGQ